MKEDITVVVAKYKENTEWVSKVPHKSIIYSKIEGEPNYIPICRDSEASTYLTYIIDHYDKLTTWTLFLHGHETHWHHPTSVLRTCEINPDNTKLKFFSVNHNRNGVIATSTRIGNLIPHEIPMDAYQEVYVDIFGQDEYNAIVNAHFKKEGKIVSQGVTHSAQFFVHKERILQRPKRGWSCTVSPGRSPPYSEGRPWGRRSSRSFWRGSWRCTRDCVCATARTPSLRARTSRGPPHCLVLCDTKRRS